MVDVEHAPLRAFEQDPPAGRDRVLQQLAGVGAERGELVRPDAALVGDADRVTDRLTLQRGQLRLDAKQQYAQSLLEVGRREVAHAQAGAAHLGLVRGADAAAGGADLAAPRRRFALPVEDGVLAEDHLRAIRDEQSPLRRDAHLLEVAQLLEERVGVDHHAVAEHALHFVVEDARGDQPQREVLVAEADGVAGVVAALETGHDVERRAQEVDDLPLPLVPPLHADDDDVAHGLTPLARPLRSF
jgi:hypothetical protein